jgi:hypothetical protein
MFAVVCAHRFAVLFKVMETSVWAAMKVEGFVVSYLPL